MCGAVQCVGLYIAVEVISTRNNLSQSDLSQKWLWSVGLYTVRGKCVDVELPPTSASLPTQPPLRQGRLYNAT